MISFFIIISFILRFSNLFDIVFFDDTFVTILLKMIAIFVVMTRRKNVIVNLS